ncbi:40S RIBOSOMAL PROTEIN S10 [Salix koriyanagi]|uniref:40S RIBOSOMAL PROTEIN S10 n=1 Tax=Salix koriyanagi TaxID=2511006 RepID=A0A9Q0P7K3_9ROSI|nr:40S RIBOSOMAL PROTEIN S10 [Salix koriyanagi]
MNRFSPLGEGVCYAKKDCNLAKHPEIDVPNLQVIKLMQSFKSKEYVSNSQSLLVVGHLAAHLVTVPVAHLALKETARDLVTRDGYRGGPRGGEGGEKGGAPADYQPACRGRPGFGRGGGGYGAAQSSSPGFA